MLAVFFPWLAFLLRGRIFSAIFSFILWVSTILEILVFGSFLLWVVLTVWCCSVMYGDRRREEMERLIEVIEATGKSLHYETQQDKTQQANKTKKMWYLAIIFLISLAILAVFSSSKENTNQTTTQATTSQVLSKKLTPKIPTQRTTKRVTATLKCKTTPSRKNNKEAEAKGR
ncbi:flagellar biosynthesis protein FlgG [Helicobacter pylori]|uniref:flagellar biosynthesis protein FlgG n=1 Tax=Helicobacter pylori TaxID=210 RepID=UPI001E391785|nr:flagellar biosynthesis protein FlgG [Helicobacter pylori]